MRVIANLIKRLQRWIAQYKAALDYADAKARRRPTNEIEWNGEMIGELRRRSSDGLAHVRGQCVGFRPLR